MNVEIAQRLAELRKKNGFSQETLAEKLGLSRQAISKWERAESSPDTDNLIALARLYGVSLDALLAIDPGLEDDIAFESQDRAQGATQAQGAAPAPAAAPPPGTPPPAPPVAPQPTAPQPSSYAVDVDGCYLDDNGRPYRRKSKLRSFPFPLLVAFVYMVCAFGFGWGKLAWLLFFTIPFYYWVVKVVEDDLNNKATAGAGGTEKTFKIIGIVTLCLVALVLVLGALSLNTFLWGGA